MVNINKIFSKEIKMQNKYLKSTSMRMALSNMKSAADMMRTIETSPTMEALRAIEDSPALKAMRDIENSPAMKVMRSMENSPAIKAMQALGDSPALKAMKALENSSALSAAKALEKSSLFTILKPLESSPALKAMKVLENSSAFSAIKALQDSSRFASFNELAEKFSSQTVGPLTLNEAYQVITNGYLQTSGSSETERIERLSNQVDLLVQKAPNGALSKEFYLGVILTLFLFWLSQISSMQSEEKILLRIDQFGTTISQQLTELKSNEETDTFYIVITAVNMRVKPNTKSEIITTLYPNMKVALIQRRSKWIRVEYFDYAENIYISGWAYKKHLKILNPKKKKY